MNFTKTNNIVMSKHKYFSSDIVFNKAFEEVDSEKGIIRGVKVCSEGEAKGHGVHLNPKFIRNVTKLGKEHGPGIKARFGHPNMCATSLGTYIGRYKNYRTKIEETENGTRHHSVADLFLDETSKNLPKLGNVWEYIMKLASTAPDMFGNSIVFTPGEEEKVTIKNEDGTETVRYDATIEELRATDLVDDPAATDGLFSVFDEGDLALQVTTFLDQHPEVYDLAVNHPDIVDTFLTKYNNHKQTKMTEDQVKTFGQKIDNLTDKFSALFEGKSNQELTDASGAKFTLEKKSGEPAVGDKATPDGVYSMTDGKSITIKDSKVFEVKEKLEESEDVKNLRLENESLNAKVVDLEAQIQSFKDAEAASKAKETEADNLITELSALKNDWKPEGRTSNPGQQSVNKNLDKDKVKENIKKLKDKK